MNLEKYSSRILNMSVARALFLSLEGM